MAKAVFTTKPDPSYDDLPEFRYHFPATYLGQVKAAVGDWVAYYEPRRVSSEPSSRGGRQAYFATARVLGVKRDPALDGHHYAQMTDYLEFDRPVPFRDGEAYRESALRKSGGATNKGAFGRAVRPLPDAEYDAILQAGFASLLEAPQAGKAYARAEDRWLWVAESPGEERLRVPLVGDRWFRDRAFTARVRETYDNRCAFTGLRLINGGGRPEVQAAHIQPVARSGPDVLRNGIALSGTVHWMFDRGLLSLEDDGRLLLSEESVPADLRRLLRPDRRAVLPEDPELRPHPRFLRFHRENVFKGRAAGGR